jgi:hypothetical protein
MIRLMLAAAISLCTGACDEYSGMVDSANVTYVHSPNELPPPGTVFVESAGEYATAYPHIDSTHPIDPADAYGWLGMYGYQQAPTAADANYILRVKEQIVPVDVDLKTYSQTLTGIPKSMTMSRRGICRRYISPCGARFMARRRPARPRSSRSTPWSVASPPIHP